ncbi:hypothetical protein FH972_026548 [Carpinus fangiana]|uniref:Uncharacterized protein n=1 Tax=Carpinus fangiana TaxID=176857 RepID=A0A5N6L4B0_9ROSI|nr:hypothetical protein FH972_026548 [Carpinus fangiana]
MSSRSPDQSPPLTKTKSRNSGSSSLLASPIEAVSGYFRSRSRSRSKRKGVAEIAILIGAGSGAIGGPGAVDGLRDGLYNSPISQDGTAEVVVKTESMGSAIVGHSRQWSGSSGRSTQTGASIDNAMFEPTAQELNPYTNLERTESEVSRFDPEDEQDLDDAISLSDQHSIASSESDDAIVRSFIVNVKVHVQDSDDLVHQRAILDTGTKVNIMSESFARETQWPLIPLPKDKRRRLRCGNKTSLTPYAVLKSVPFYFSDRPLRGAMTHRLQFYVCEDCAFDVLLGWKFIGDARLFKYNNLALVLLPENANKKEQLAREELKRSQSENHRQAQKERRKAKRDSMSKSTTAQGNSSAGDSAINSQTQSNG